MSVGRGTGRAIRVAAIAAAALVTAVLLVMKFGLSSDGKKGPEKKASGKGTSVERQVGFGPSNSTVIPP